MQLNEFFTHQICEKSSKPSRACSGFVKMELNRVILPWMLAQIPGCRGVPRFSWNDEVTIPIGLKDIDSSVGAEEASPELLLGAEHDSHLQVFNEERILSMSF